MDTVVVLDQTLQLGFLGVGLAAVWQWYRRRTRAAAYLAGAFGLLTLVLVTVRIAPSATDETWLSMVVIGSLGAFPWLLAAFAWAFAGPLPRWLRLAGLAVPLLVVWAATVPPIPATGARTTEQATFLAAFLVLWSTLSGAMALRLWRAGGRQRLVRARMRLMAVAALLLTAALLASAVGSSASRVVDVTTSLLALGSVGLFVAGFAPPHPLRAWWRRRSSQQFQRMQVALIGSATPEAVAQAVAPLVADLLGSGVAVVDEHGTVLATAQLDDDEAREIADRVVAGRTLPEGTKAVEVADAHLVVRNTPYSPVFGQDELELMRTLSLQMRLALERAELYRSEQAAREEAQAVRNDLESTLYSLSHDLKSPSLAISGFADLLPEATTDAERDEMLGHIRASSAYLHQLVEAMLDLSRIGRTQTETRAVDLNDTADNVVQRAAVACPEATVRIARPLPTIEINEVRAEQLLDNLVGNALAHSGRADVEITIDARRRDAEVEISVADNGRGVPDEDRERIFELFQRGSTSVGRGSGVGLGVVRRIADACGGTLELADSEVGARFVVRLPAHLLVDAAQPAGDPDAGDHVGAPATRGQPPPTGGTITAAAPAGSDTVDSHHDGGSVGMDGEHGDVGTQ